MATPVTADARESLTEALEEFRAWASTSDPEERGERLERALRANEALLGAEPSYAPDVQQLVLGPVHLMKAVEPDGALRLGDLGRRAAVMVPDTGTVTVTRIALLELALAEAAIFAERDVEAITSLDTLDRLRASLPLSGPLDRFLGAADQCLRGRIHERALEQEKACAAYRAAVDGITPLISRTAQRAAVGNAWLEAAVGAVDPEQQDAAAATVTEEVLGPVLVWALLGRARVDLELPDGDAVKWLRSTRKAIRRFGVPEGLGIVQLGQVVGFVAMRWGLDEGHAFADAFTDEQLRRAGLSPEQDRPVLLAALAHAAQLQGEALLEGVLYQEALAKANATGSKLTVARVLGRYIGDNVEEPDVEHELLESYLTYLTLWGFSSPTLPERVEYEPALRTLVDYAVALWRERRSRIDRLRLGILVDLLKRPDWVPLPSRDRLERSADVIAMDGLWAAMDWFRRLQVALARHPDTAVIVLRAARSRTAMFCVTPDSDAIVEATMWNEEQIAGSTLAAAARAELEFIVLSGAPAGDAFEHQCRAAYLELPSEVRAVITAHEHLVIVPDVNADADSAPFELLHDGGQYLGVTKVISRAASLRDAAVALERPNRALARRALVVAAPHGDGEPELVYAESEVEHVRDVLQADGWDVPAIERDRLTAAFLTDRLQHVGIAHLSAHGTVMAGEEALLLGAGRRLTERDIAERGPARLPFVYLNACFLGTTRYLGGGVRRGLAHALTALGAPAVVANLTPVDDLAAARISAAFYDEAQTHPVGVALRNARARLAREGVPAPLWGTSILLGDPHVRLHEAPAEEAEPDRAARLLDAFAGDPRRWSLEWYPGDAIVVPGDEPDDPRLRGAVGLVRSVHAAAEAEHTRAAPELHFAGELADRLGHPPSSALVRLLEAEGLAAAGRLRPAVVALERALPAIDSLHEVDPTWGPLRLQMYGEWKRLRMTLEGERVPVLEVDGTQEEVNRRLNELLGAQAIAERGAPVGGFRIPEENAEDIAWNAMLLAHPRRLVSLRSRAEAATQLIAKLELRGYLMHAPSWAPTVLTGLLDQLWKGLTPVDEDRVRHAGDTLLRVIDSLRGAASYTGWLPEAMGLEAAIRTSARMDDVAPVEDGRTLLAAYRRHFRRQWEELAERVRADDPDAIAPCSAYVLGAVIGAHELVPEDEPRRRDALAYLRALLTGLEEPVQHAGLLEAYSPGPAEADGSELRRWREEDGLTGDDSARIRHAG
jgi:CHAT domain-containing protein